MKKKILGLTLVFNQIDWGVRKALPLSGMFQAASTGADRTPQSQIRNAARDQLGSSS